MAGFRRAFLRPFVLSNQLTVASKVRKIAYVMLTVRTAFVPRKNLITKRWSLHLESYCTVNVSVSVRTTPPLLAKTVMGNVPSEVFPLVLTVKVADPDAMMDCALRLGVAPI